MRTYKSIERPSQVLGMNLQDLAIIVVLFLASVFAMGVLANIVHISRMAMLVVLLVELALLLFLRYLGARKPPGFLVAWVSFRFFQPRRIRVGALPAPRYEKTSKNRRI